MSSYLYSALVVSASTLRFFLFAAQEDEGDLTGNEWKGSISGDYKPVLTAQSPVYGPVNDQVLVKNYLEKGRPSGQYPILRMAACLTCDVKRNRSVLETGVSDRMQHRCEDILLGTYFDE